jgi:cytoskeletal protein CcmA (bactofilin family)
MNRITGIVSALLLGLLILVPVASAADPFYEDGRVIVSVKGDITFPAGETADSLIVIEGTATVEGDVKSVYVVNGTVNFVGSRTDGIVAIASKVNLDSGSVVAGDIRVIATTVDQAAGATIEGRINNGLDLARAALFIGPALFILYIGFVIAAIGAALLLAGLASRQVRSAEALISHEPGTAFVAGLGGLIAIIVVATLAIVTIVGIPLGLGILLGFLPVVAFAGYLVTGIWIGDWILRQVSPGHTQERPYLAAVVGILILSVVTLIPVVGGLVSFLGMGAVVLLMWRTLRRDANSEPASQPVAASTVA